LGASQDAYRESQQSLQESQAEKRNLQIQLEASQDAYHESQQLLQQSQQSLQTTQAEKENLQAQTEALQRRVQDAEHRAEAERRARDARQGENEGEPSWVVQRDEINLTDTELGRGGETSAIHAYNTTTNSWDIVSHMATPQLRCLVAVLPPNDLLVVGGRAPGGDTDSVKVATII